MTSRHDDKRADRGADRGADRQSRTRLCAPRLKCAGSIDPRTARSPRLLPGGRNPHTRSSTHKKANSSPLANARSMPLRRRRRRLTCVHRVGALQSGSLAASARAARPARPAVRAARLLLLLPVAELAGAARPAHSARRPLLRRLALERGVATLLRLVVARVRAAERGARLLAPLPNALHLAPSDRRSALLKLNSITIQRQRCARTAI